MKDYLIFLKGGNCIEGSIDEDEIAKLQDDFLNYKCCPSIRFHEYHDETGRCVIDFDEVQAIATNKQVCGNHMGY